MSKAEMQAKFKRWTLTEDIAVSHQEADFKHFRPQMFGIQNDYQMPYFQDLEDANFYAVFWYSAFLRAMKELNRDV